MPRQEKQKDPSRELRIKTGILKRVRKDLISYRQEEIDNRTNIQNMQNANRDIYDIRKQEEVLEETLMMIPRTLDRLREAKADLQECLNANRESITDSELIEAAETMISQAIECENEQAEYDGKERSEREAINNPSENISTEELKDDEIF